MTSSQMDDGGSTGRVPSPQVGSACLVAHRIIFITETNLEYSQISLSLQMLNLV